MKQKIKKCKNCKELFTPRMLLQQVCSIKCATEIAIKKRISDGKKALQLQKRELIAKKKSLLTVSGWIKKVDAAYNPWVRLRDEKAGLPCPSCLRYDHQIPDSYFGKWDCGHFLSKGSHPELRYEPLNSWRQCKSCNGGSGNYAKKNHTVSQTYRLTLVDRIGLEKVEWLEGPHKPKLYRITDLMELEAEYKLKLKGLQSSLKYG